METAVHIGFTGTSKGMTPDQLATVRGLLAGRRYPTRPTVHHGDCIGADTEFHEVAAGMGLWVVIHPPKEDKGRAFNYSSEQRNPKPYLERNHDIVDECEELFATPRTENEVTRSGTWATVRYARKVGVPVVVIRPDGKIVRS